MLVRLAVGYGLSRAIVRRAVERRSLTPDGARWATVVGTATYAGGGPVAFAALGTFFVTSTMLGKVAREHKAATKREFSKSDTRDGWQVLANGGVAAATIALHGLTGHRRLLVAGAAALAAANADTWATEVGILSPREPWSLRRWRRVPTGTSGGVSGLGTLAAAAGAGAVGAVVALHPAFAGRRLATAVLLQGIGLGGALLDSTLGETVQVAYYCRRCRRETEQELHHCGEVGRRVRGFRVVSNDAVNFAATLGASMVGAAFGR